MIEKYFKYIIELPDVEVVAIFDNQGKLIKNWNNSYFDSSILNEIGKNYLQIFGLKAQLNSDEEEIAIQFEQGALYVRNFLTYFLVIYGKSEVSIPYLRLAANVSSSIFEQSKDFKKMFKTSPHSKVLNINDTSMDDVEKFIFQSIFKK